ncbi:MAG: methyltransferase domain-containing protein, partial [Candidatus Margulisiibacteriota bacterium]
LPICCGNKSFLLDSVSYKIKSGVGLDYEVKNKKKNNIEYINYKFNGNLPLKDKCFDKIFLLAVLEHIETDKVGDLFLEFKRILKNDGKIVLTTPTLKSRWLLEFLAYKMKLISSQEIKDHKKYYDKEEIMKLAKEDKLKLIDYKLFQFGLNSRAVFKK